MTAPIIHPVTGAPLTPAQLADADPDRVIPGLPGRVAEPLSRLFASASRRGVVTAGQLWERIAEGAGHDVTTDA